MRPRGPGSEGGQAGKSVAAENAQRKGDFEFWGYIAMYEQILEIVHQTAAELMTAKGLEVVEHGSAVITEGADSLIDRYGFSSIDTLEYLLILEEKFGITLADEDLSEEVLSSASALTQRIGEMRATALLG
jgi:acyl carrier protein